MDGRETLSIPQIDHLHGESEAHGRWPRWRTSVRCDRPGVRVVLGVALGRRTVPWVIHDLGLAAESVLVASTLSSWPISPWT